MTPWITSDWACYDYLKFVPLFADWKILETFPGQWLLESFNTSNQGMTQTPFCSILTHVEIVWIHALHKKDNSWPTCVFVKQSLMKIHGEFLTSVLNFPQRLERILVNQPHKFVNQYINSYTWHCVFELRTLFKLWVRNEVNL